MSTSPYVGYLPSQEDSWVSESSLQQVLLAAGAANLPEVWVFNEGKGAAYLREPSQPDGYELVYCDDAATFRLNMG